MATRGGKSGKKAAKTYERPGLSEEEIEEIKEAFNLFDTDGSGKHASLICMRYLRGKAGFFLHGSRQLDNNCKARLAHHTHPPSSPAF